MSSVSTTMTRDHRDCDAQFATAESAAANGDWPAAQRAIDAFRTAMERHFRLEEEALFPAFERHTGMTQGPTEVMRLEHAEMRGLFERLGAAAAGADADEFLGLGETLNLLVQQHNMKEEQVLYALLDEALGAEGVRLLESFAHD
jgi:hemerythrin-like domain-containing protein